MMREKIEEILSRTNVAADEIDALIAAIGEGQEPVTLRNLTDWWESEFGKTAAITTERVLLAVQHFATPQPAPDVAAMQAVIQHERDCMEAAKARIAELERQSGDAARQHNADVSALEEKLFQRTREKAELERVQGVLVEALEKIEAHHIEQNALKGRSEERSFTLCTIRAALAEVKKPAQQPEGGDRG